MSKLTDDLVEVYGKVSQMEGVEKPEILAELRLCLLNVAALENENQMNAKAVTRLSGVIADHSGQGLLVQQQTLEALLEEFKS